MVTEVPRELTVSYAHCPCGGYKLDACFGVSKLAGSEWVRLDLDGPNVQGTWWSGPYVHFTHVAVRILCNWINDLRNLMVLQEYYPE